MNSVQPPVSSHVPELAKACHAFSEFLETVAALRHPETGCPWDLQQDHRTLARFMIEEAYEASEHMTSGHASAELCGELGDVLLQVVLNSQVSLDDGRFSIVDVIQSINAKMLRRHPHVFGNSEQRSRRDIDSIKKSWLEIKEQEKLKSSEASDLIQVGAAQTENLPKNSQSVNRDDSIKENLDTHSLPDSQPQDPSSQSVPGMKLERESGVFQKAKVDKVFPAALKAHKIGEIARRIQFDWSSAKEVLQKLESEIIELRQALDQSNGEELSISVLDELGDVYFSLNQLARHLGTNGESAAEHGNQKFLTRFIALEALAQKRGLSIDECNPAMLEELWRQAKTSGSLS